MKRAIAQFVGFTLTSTLLLGCVTNPDTGEQEVSNKGKGAAIGAAVGALLGVATGDDGKERRKRALIGAGIGALAGTAVGHYMDEQEEKLREELAGSGVEVERDGDQINLNMPGNITFATNSSDIRSDFFDTLNRVASVMKEYDRTTIDVVGHTDSQGTDTYNQQLSERRAQSVSRYLASNGVQNARIVAIGRGETQPVSTNDTDEGRQENRRVELKLQPIVQQASAGS